MAFEARTRRIPASRGKTPVALGNSRAIRSSVRLLVAILLVSFVSPARADEVRPSLELTTGVRFETGLDSDAGLSLGLVRLGLDWRVAPSLILSASALGLMPFGETDAGERSNGGLGGELGLRLVPWRGDVIEPFLAAGVGILLFDEDAPFLPGGDRYEGILTYGLGVDLRLDALTLGLELHYVHLSNGQGLGDHNPAYDGLGVTLVARVGLDEPRWPDGPWDGIADRIGARLCFEPGVWLDLGYGRVADADLWTGRLRLAERLSDDGFVHLDVEAGTLAGERLVEAGVALVEHFDHLSLGVHVGFRDYADLGTLVGVLQLEGHITPEATLVAMGQIEAGELAEPLGRAGIGLRLFPFPSMLVELGVGFDRIGDGSIGDASDPYLGLEWQLPIALPNWQFSLFLERQIATIDVVGIRLAYTSGGRVPSLRDTARHLGWRRLR